MKIDIKKIKSPKILKSLISQGYMPSVKEIKRMPLSAFIDYDLMKYALVDILNIFKIKDGQDFNILKDLTKESDEYIERFIRLYVDALNTPWTISKVKEILFTWAESNWAQYKKQRVNTLTNIFGRICMELENNNDYSTALSNMGFLSIMEKVLEDK